ncbi:MAG: hypothetical protein HKN08_01485 [Gammaproteobacteria bacterium]|nr:hypothetical protein [Gammaproteobacteria bacterium]
MRLIITLMLLLSLVSGCREADNRKNVPALISNPGPDTHEEIQLTVSRALNGVDVTLADDVFISSSVLVIDRGMIRRVERPPEMGRDFGRPSRFQLLTNGSECMIVNVQSGVYWPLTITKCIREK